MTTELRAALAECYQALGRAGLIAGSSGNLSVRTPDGMLISPTGADAATIGPGHIVATSLDRPAPGASSEWALHAALYAARPEFGAIVHTHADACTALACLNEPLPAFHYGVLTFGGPDIRCAPYVTFGTPALAEVALAAMDGRTACLLANHGMITAAATLPNAVASALELERLCRQYLLARAAGTPRLLTPAEIADATERLASYGAAARPALPEIEAL